MRSRRVDGRRAAVVPATLLTLLLLLVVVGLAACSDGGDSAGRSDGSATPAVTPTSDSPSSLDSVEAARPRPGDCHAMSLAQVTATSAGDTSTDCQHRPTTITVAVGSLRVKGREVAPGSAAAQELMRRA